jgi:hypothetical protein
VIAVLYAGEPVVVRWWQPGGGVEAAGFEVADVVEIAETTGGSLVLRSDTERVLCPAGTWGRIAWPAPAA